MRRAIIEGSVPEAEQPIRYRLVQQEECVTLEAIVGDVAQSLLLLYPYRIQKVDWVSDKLGLPLDRGGGSVSIEEAS